jgi:hypothetical protein
MSYLLYHAYYTTKLRIWDTERIYARSFLWLYIPSLHIE